MLSNRLSLPKRGRSDQMHGITKWLAGTECINGFLAKGRVELCRREVSDETCIDRLLPFCLRQTGRADGRCRESRGGGSEGRQKMVSAQNSK